jgi:hypothetical protein
MLHAHLFADRFHFHDDSELPPPPAFAGVTKTYRSGQRGGRCMPPKRAPARPAHVAKAPPPPPPGGPRPVGVPVKKPGAP